VKRKLQGYTFSWARLKELDRTLKTKKLKPTGRGKFIAKHMKGQAKVISGKSIPTNWGTARPLRLMEKFAQGERRGTDAW